MKEEKKQDDKRLIWRLQERPSVENITKLVEQEIIDKDQARQILFEETTHSQIKTMEDVQRELVLLRKMVEGIAPSTTITDLPIWRTFTSSTPNWTIRW